MVTYHVTSPNRVKFTVTADGDIRIKFNEKATQSDKDRYTNIGYYISNLVKSFGKTMRGNMLPDAASITMYNDNKNESLAITLPPELLKDTQ